MVDDCCYLWDLEAGLITNRDDHLCGEYSSEVLAIWEVDSGSRPTRGGQIIAPFEYISPQWVIVA
jgi:hypothetical protein